MQALFSARGGAVGYESGGEVEMRCLSLTQPWATLVAIGAKCIETRSWATAYRGPLAIHASKGFPKWAKEFSKEPPASVLLGMHYDYPLGSVIATCRLVDCVSTRQLWKETSCAKCNGTGKIFCWQDGQPGPDYCSNCDGNGTYFLNGGKLSEQERSFGDYAEGRFAWMLHDVQMLPEAIPAKGALGLWEWAAPAESRSRAAALDADIARMGER